MRATITLPLLACLPFTRAACLLCEDGLEGMKRPHYFVDRAGTTCTKVAMDIFILDASGPACSEEILRYRETCCGKQEPKPLDQIPTSAPALSIEHTGPYEKCDLCRNGYQPGNPGMVINMLYLGEGSCAQYFVAGREGSVVPGHMCAPLQFFAYDPCGCAHGTPIQDGDVIDERSNPPQATIPTGRPPTARPTLSPTRKPSGKPPTVFPTQAPSSKPAAPPTSAPSHKSTAAPSSASPSDKPSNLPTDVPSSNLSSSPTWSPSVEPSSAPSRSPTISFKTGIPTAGISNVPTSTPSTNPTISSNPTSQPTLFVAQQRLPDTDGKEGIERWSYANTRGGQGGVRQLKGTRL